MTTAAATLHRFEPAALRPACRSNNDGCASGRGFRTGLRVTAGVYIYIVVAPLNPAVYTAFRLGLAVYLPATVG